MLLSSVSFLLARKDEYYGWSHYGFFSVYATPRFRLHALPVRRMGSCDHASSARFDKSCVRTLCRVADDKEEQVTTGRGGGGSSNGPGGGGSGGDPPEGPGSSAAPGPSSDFSSRCSAVVFVCILALAICTPCIVVATVVKRGRRRRIHAHANAATTGRDDKNRAATTRSRTVLGLFVLVMLTCLTLQGIASHRRKQLGSLQQSAFADTSDATPGEGSTEAKDVRAWFEMGVSGGGTVEGTRYSEKECYIKALELDDKDAKSWYQLGSLGGGTVAGIPCSATTCFSRAKELQGEGESPSIDASVSNNNAVHGHDD